MRILYEAARLGDSATELQRAELRESWEHVLNRGTPQLRKLAEYYFANTDAGKTLAKVCVCACACARVGLREKGGARGLCLNDIVCLASLSPYPLELTSMPNVQSMPPSPSLSRAAELPAAPISLTHKPSPPPTPRNTTHPPVLSHPP